MDDVKQCPQCLGDGVDGISFLGVFACPRCDGRGTVKPNLTVEPLSKTYKFDLDQLTQWVVDGCPEGVSGIPAQVAELIAFARHRTNHAQAEPVAPAQDVAALVEALEAAHDALLSAKAFIFTKYGTQNSARNEAIELAASALANFGDKP